MVGSDGLVIYRGRLWLAIYLWILAPICFGLAIATIVFIGWVAFLVMGLVLLIVGWYLVLIGLGEAVARVELRPDGFRLRLPRYRGYLPFWPIQCLDAAWSDVTALHRRRVEARLFFARFDYVRDTIATRHGEAVLFEPLPNDFFANTRGTGQHLPVPEILQIFRARTGIVPGDDPSTNGGGLLSNMVFGDQEPFDRSSGG